MSEKQSKKTVRIVLIVSLAVLLSGWLILVHNETKIKELKTSGIEEGYEHYIDALNYAADNHMATRDYITLSGWLKKRGEFVWDDVACAY